MATVSLAEDGRLLYEELQCARIHPTYNERFWWLAKIHAVLMCDSRNTVWNRDAMTAYNIHQIFVHMAKNNNKRSTIFTRRNAMHTAEQDISVQ